MAAGATAKGKAMPARGVLAKTLEEVAGGEVGEEAPQGESESTYSSYYSSSQSSDAQAQESERPAAKEKPRTPSGERPQARPQPDARREPSGGREQQPGSPPRGQPRARPVPPERGSPCRGRRIELVQVIRSVDRGAGHPSDRRPSPRKSPLRRRSGSPDRRRRISPRRKERFCSRRRRPSPHRDGRSRSSRLCCSRGRDRGGRWSGRTQPRWAGGDSEEDAVQARLGQSRTYRPQEARRQREEGFQDSGKAKGWYQTHGDQAGASRPRWQDQSWLRDRLHGGGKGKSQNKGGGRRGKGSKARLRQQARNAQPRTEKQREYKGRRDDRTAQRLTTAIQNINEHREGSGSCDRSSAAHEGAGGSGSGPAKQPPSPRTHGAAGWFQ